MTKNMKRLNTVATAHALTFGLAEDRPHKNTIETKKVIRKAPPEKKAKRKAKQKSQRRNR